MPANSISDLSQEKPIQKESNWRFIWKLVGPHRKWIYIVMAAMIFEACMSMAAPWPLKIVIDQVIGKEPLPQALAFLPSSWLSNASTLVLASVLAVCIIAAFSSLGAYINSYFTEILAQKVASDLRLKLYHHLHRLSLSYFDKHETARIINTMTADVSTIQDFASQSVLRIMVDILTITGMVVVMFWLHWDFGLIVLVMLPIMIAMMTWFKKRVKAASREVRKDQSTMAAVMQQGLESMRTTNAFGRHQWEEERLAQINGETVKAALRSRRLKAALPALINITVALCTAYVIWRGSMDVMAGTLTIGVLTVFLAYLAKVMMPAQDMAKMANIMAQASVAYERVQQILQADAVLPEATNGWKPGKVKGVIAFEALGFSYVPGHTVIRNFNLHIGRGEQVGICGPSGCGKSTIASLLARFYDADEGSITIDGINVKEFDLEALRSQIGFVLQDTFIFYGTARDNIAYGKPGASEEEIMRAASLARADSFISKMEQGYDTILGERGTTLSGGQKQCIGIARAILRDAPILVLDEPTASLDLESESIVMSALEELKKGRTVITIAHRLSTLQHCDQIIVLKEGKVFESGRHAELLEREGFYAGLFHLQVASTGKENETIYQP